jgi:hypothetical protein
MERGHGGGLGFGSSGPHPKIIYLNGWHSTTESLDGTIFLGEARRVLTFDSSTRRMTNLSITFW